MIDVTGLSVANDDWIKSVKSNSSLEKNEKRTEHVSEESLNQRILQNVEHVLRKSYKDTLSKRHASSRIMTKTSESSFDNKTVFEVQNASKTRKVMEREENESCRSSERNKVVNINVM